MNDERMMVLDADSGKTDEQLAGLRLLTLAIYILYAFSWIAGLTAIVAIVINHVKREDVQETLYASHFTWQIRTFWWGLAWSLLSLLALPGLLGLLSLFHLSIGAVPMAFLVLGIWVLYRLVKGLLYWHDRKPLPI